MAFMTPRLGELFKARGRKRLGSLKSFRRPWASGPARGLLSHPPWARSRGWISEGVC